MDTPVYGDKLDPAMEALMQQAFGMSDPESSSDNAMMQGNMQKLLGKRGVDQSELVKFMQDNKKGFPEDTAVNMNIDQLMEQFLSSTISDKVSKGGK